MFCKQKISYFMSYVNFLLIIWSNLCLKTFFSWMHLIILEFSVVSGRINSFSTSILKSLVILAISLALSMVINSQITLFFITSVLDRVIHVLNRIIFVLNRIIFVSIYLSIYLFVTFYWLLYLLSPPASTSTCYLRAEMNFMESVWNTKWDEKALLFTLFNKLATWSIKYWHWLNSAISKWP